jgi:hypothetical protein
LEAMWDVAPESMTQSPTTDGGVEVLAALLRAAISAEQSQDGGPCGVAGGGELLPNAWPCRGASMVV